MLVFKMASSLLLSHKYKNYTVEYTPNSIKIKSLNGSNCINGGNCDNRIIYHVKIIEVEKTSLITYLAFSADPIVDHCLSELILRPDVPDEIVKLADMVK